MFRFYWIWLWLIELVILILLFFFTVLFIFYFLLTLYFILFYFCVYPKKFIINCVYLFYILLKKLMLFKKKNFLCNRDISVHSYKLHFSSSHFSFQLNKRVCYLFTLPSQTKYDKGKLKSLR